MSADGGARMTTVDELRDALLRETNRHDRIWTAGRLDAIIAAAEARGRAGLAEALEEVRSIAHAPSLAWRSTLVGRMRRIEDIAIAALATPPAPEPDRHAFRPTPAPAPEADRG